MELVCLQLVTTSAMIGLNANSKALPRNATSSLRTSRILAVGGGVLSFTCNLLFVAFQL